MAKVHSKARWVAKPFLRDEAILSFEALIDFDPVEGSISTRARSLIDHHDWSTDQVMYCMAHEPIDDNGNYVVPSTDRLGRRFIEATHRWSITFLMGLDQIHDAGKRWVEDVSAIVRFYEQICTSTDAGFTIVTIGVCRRSKPRSFELIGYVNGPDTDVERLAKEILYIV